MSAGDQTPPPPVPESILIRGVNWLGDAVMTAPALAQLRQRFPHTRIALLTPQKLAPLWQQHGGLDSVLSFAPGESPFAIAGRLRRERFETALIFPNSPRSALEAWLARIPRRVGYAGAWRRGLLSEVVAKPPGWLPMRKRRAAEIRRLIQSGPQSAEVAWRPSPESHHLHHYLHLAASLGASPQPLAPRFQVQPEEVAAARSAWLVHGYSGEATDGLGARWAEALARAPQLSGTAPVCLGLIPSAAYGEAKRWPAEHFAAVAREVSRRAPAILWLALGEAADATLCERIAALSEVRMRNLAGKTSLRELMALLSLCRVVLTNDSGPMHLAAALGTTVVVPFGSTSPELTGPGLPGDPRHHLFKSVAPCSPCFRRSCPIDLRCLRDIRPDLVADAVLKALAEA